jgi:hypothetical protein
MAHLRTPILWMGTRLARALAAAYLEYASLGPTRAALHLDLLSSLGDNGFFSIPLGRVS